MNKIFIILTLALLFSSKLLADVKMPFTFNKGMILQHGVKHPVWGMAEPGEKVTVEFAGQKMETVADKAGEWQVILEPMAPDSKPQQMLIKGKNTIKLNDIVVGEVWLSIGSGAMGKRNLKIPKNEQDKMFDSEIRIHLMPNANAILPISQNFIPCMWMDAGKKRLNNWPAVPFFFLQNLKAKLNMPVGLLNGAFARGGSPHLYMPYSAHKFLQGKQYQKLINQMAANDITSDVGKKTFEQKTAAIAEWIKNFEAALAKGEYPPERPVFDGEKDVSTYPSSIYNVMINPVKRFPVRGCIVYLEKTYAEKSNEYFDKIGALIDGVREDFKRPEMPMIIVNTVDVSSPAAEKIMASRKQVQFVPGVGKGGWKNPLPAKDVAKSICNAAIKFTEKK